MWRTLQRAAAAFVPLSTMSASMPTRHAEEVAEKVRGRPLPDGRGSVSGCKHDAPILSHDRKGVGCRLFQQPLLACSAGIRAGGFGRRRSMPASMTKLIERRHESFPDLTRG